MTIKGSISKLQASAKGRMNAIAPERTVRFLEAQTDVSGSVEILHYETLTSGSGGSNGIAILSCRLDIGQGMEECEFVLRYSPGVQLLKTKRFSDEFETQKAAFNAGLATPRVSWMDETGEWLGCSGYIMDRVEGRSPNSAMYSSGLLAEVSASERSRMMLDCVGFHGRLRRLSLGPDNVPHLALEAGQSAIEHELNRWLKELALIDLEDGPHKTYVQNLVAWLLEYQPSLRAPSLVHGDPQIANAMFHGGELVSMLDWELSWLGYSEADLAMMVLIKEAYKTIDAAVEGVPTEQEYVCRFEEEAGTSIEHWEYFKLFETVKLLAIMLMATTQVPPEQREQILSFYFDLVDKQWNETRKVY